MKAERDELTQEQMASKVAAGDAVPLIPGDGIPGPMRVHHKWWVVRDGEQVYRAVRDAETAARLDNDARRLHAAQNCVEQGVELPHEQLAEYAQFARRHAEQIDREARQARDRAEALKWASQAEELRAVAHKFALTASEPDIGHDADAYTLSLEVENARMAREKAFWRAREAHKARAAGDFSTASTCADEAHTERELARQCEQRARQSFYGL